MSRLATLPSEQLLAQLRQLIARDNALEAELLAHLAEVDARRLYLGEGCSSMFDYCTRVLHLSEDVAYKRIGAARASRAHPPVLEALRRGEIHLTGLRLLAPELTHDNVAELLAAARHKTADQIRALLADRRPKPDVRASTRRVAAGHRSACPVPAETRASLGVEAKSSAPVPEPTAAQRPPMAAEPGTADLLGSASHAAVVRRASTKPLGQDRYAVRFTADRELHDQLQELQALLRHQIPDGDLAKIIAKAVAVLLPQVRRQKHGAPSSKPTQKAKPAHEQRPATRHIPAAIRRAVWKRDAGRCTFVSRSGRRCDATAFVEFHHSEPWAHARHHSVEGITLRCRAHNQFQAERDFGRDHMARSRNTSKFELAPEPVVARSRRSPTNQVDTDRAGSPAKQPPPTRDGDEGLARGMGC